MFVLLAALLSGCMSHERVPEDGGPRDSGSCACDAGHPPCSADRAVGQGACDTVLGYRWSGSECEAISGCTCGGPECARLTTTLDACVAANAMCGPATCGGLVGAVCSSDAYCDFPDMSFCGGDDSTGVCRPRPTECPEPGGVPVCGCDGNEYFNECAAMAAGTDVARLGPCVTTTAYDTARADRDCAPADGPAWRITLTTDRESCDLEPSDGSVVFSVWHALESATSDTTYTLATDLASDGQAMICGGSGPCVPATGTIVFHVFAVGEVARFDFDVRTEDGRRFEARDVEIARWWCSTGPVGCG